jgi:hypothetical protein
MIRYWRSGGIAPRILDLDTKWRWVVSFTLLVPIRQEVWWAPGPIWMRWRRENDPWPRQESNYGRPARSLVTRTSRTAVVMWMFDVFWSFIRVERLSVAKSSWNPAKTWMFMWLPSYRSTSLKAEMEFLFPSSTTDHKVSLRHPFLINMYFNFGETHLACDCAYCISSSTRVSVDILRLIYREAIDFMYVKYLHEFQEPE